MIATLTASVPAAGATSPVQAEKLAALRKQAGALQLQWLQVQKGAAAAPSPVAVDPTAISQQLVSVQTQIDQMLLEAQLARLGVTAQAQQAQQAQQAAAGTNASASGQGSAHGTNSAAGAADANANSGADGAHGSDSHGGGGRNGGAAAVNPYRTAFVPGDVVDLQA